MSGDVEPTPPETHRKAPFLRRVRIRNFKSIQFCDVTLEPLTVLVGRNGSGKSNFVEALAFVRDLISLNFSEAIARHGGIESITPRGATEATCMIELDLEVPFCRKVDNDTWPGDSIYRWSFAMPLRLSSPFEWTESLITSGEIFGSSMEFIYRPGYLGIRGKPQQEWKGFEFATEGVQRPLLALFSQDHPAPFLVRMLTKIGTYSLLPNVMRSLQKRDTHSLMSQDGSNAVFILSRVISRPNDYERLLRFLSIVVPGLVGVTPVSFGTYHGLRFLMESGKGNRVEFDASSMSDGTLRLFASLLAAIQTTPEGLFPTVVAIEEPETSLHPAAMHALVDALDEATGRTQILLTTHSTELLDNPTIRPENVRVVEMVNGETVITPVDEASVEIVKRQLDTLGGLERQNQLALNDADRDRQQQLATGVEPK